MLVFAVDQPLILGLEHHVYSLFFALVAPPGVDSFAVFLLSYFCLGKVLVTNMTCPFSSGLEAELNTLQPALATEPTVEHFALFDEDNSVQGFVMYMMEFIVLRQLLLGMNVGSASRAKNVPFIWVFGCQVVLHNS